jgi:hypothetical protein
MEIPDELKGDDGRESQRRQLNEARFVPLCQMGRTIKGLRDEMEGPWLAWGLMCGCRLGVHSCRRIGAWWATLVFAGRVVDW